MQIRAFISHTVRYSTLALCVVGALASLIWMAAVGRGWGVSFVFVALVALAVMGAYNINQ